MRINASTPPLTVSLPNHESITSIGAGFITFPHLSTTLAVYIFPDTTLEHSLLSISAFCNLGCTATFTHDAVTITKDSNIVATACKRSHETLWCIDVPTTFPPIAAANAAFALPSDKDFVAFAHAAFGRPAISTFSKAIARGYISTFPRLTSRLLHAHPPNALATAQGHLDQQRQGQDSTQPSSTVVTFATDNTIPNHPPSPRTSTYVKCITTSHTAHSDLTGRFPVVSRTGNQYLLVSVLDSYIHAEPMKSRHHTEFIKAYAATIKWFTDLGHKPVFQRLDNETSIPLETFIKKLDISVQYCPPSQHRALKAERAIRTFKNHAIATFCTTSKLFPMDIWDLLLPQILLCINHLTPFAPNPTVSAYAGLHGDQHDFRAHPIAPAGTRILVHDKPSNRASWAPHGVPGFYLGPASKHYRCYTVWVTPTNAVRITDTVAWFPEHGSMPTLNPHDSVIAVIKDLSNTLQTFGSVVSPTRSHIDDPILLELRTLAAIYQSAIYQSTGSRTACHSRSAGSSEGEHSISINPLCITSEGVIRDQHPTS